MALERRQIVERALALLDEVGMDGLSTRRLAAELGVKGPSLYWHFRNMRELFNHMAEALLETALPAPGAFPHDWQAWLADGARGIRRAALSHRDGARLLAGSVPTGQSLILDFEAMRGRLEAEGFRRGEAHAALMVLGRYAMGWALYEQLTPTLPPYSDKSFEYGLQAMIQGIADKTPAASRPRAEQLRPA
ncbi:TetR/AcrR family transcriptional regulator C-terminal domain-containing protein [Phenylobacterium sp.]|jgi:TetR/AcrR family tetracycline transcriptional repressor|uniref:TetR/AcrR family transcriptional regulator C-terminal domain-containing protein n=1 Tax=Phenylobacterium sp. TaxID=1871053 RepID=UPI002F421462